MLLQYTTASTQLSDLYCFSKDTCVQAYRRIHYVSSELPIDRPFLFLEFLIHMSIFLAVLDSFDASYDRLKHRFVGLL